MFPKSVIAFFSSIILAGTTASSCLADEPAEEASTLHKGTVEILDSGKSGVKPRLVRPPSPVAPPSGVLKTIEASKGSTSESDEMLKARVFSAAGIGLPDRKLTAGADKGLGRYGLSAHELSQLSKYEICVMLDCSGSMTARDCEPLNIFIFNEPRISRWEWVQQQTTLLSRQLADAVPSGITVVPFASFARRLPNVSPAAIDKVFAENMPGGGTMLDAAFDVELDGYFADRAAGRTKKPLLIAVITDGVPNQPQAVVDQIVQLSTKIRPGEIRIAFFLIGDSPAGLFFINRLCTVGGNASYYSIVTAHSFREVSTEGLPRMLVKTVLE